MTETPETAAPATPGATNPATPVYLVAGNGRDELRAELTGIIHAAYGGQLHTTFATDAAARVLDRLATLPLSPDLIDQAAERGHDAMFEGTLPNGIERALWHQVVRAILSTPGLFTDPEAKYRAQMLAEEARDAAFAERDQLLTLVRSVRDALLEGGQNAQSRWSRAVRLLEQADLLRGDGCRSDIRLQPAGQPLPRLADKVPLGAPIWRDLDRKYAEAIREINRLHDALEQCECGDLDDEPEGRPIVDVHLPEAPGG